ncbi:hypothetical protein BGZ61DRAFT_442934 [Ilyonectria robusta]|uniref:uncharacterized protein n=1 Tax=Ilyonectria robusta TaxID=1079257 RepID=UPI001E8D91A5|nr:uncharacterized protein BGZ61DRAFT_442934 [Ilyonectria robusta]KAH8734676.1 hypothetical protein BGZ61DRAFT_442934 [Ilyonectria robusta]
MTISRSAYVLCVPMCVPMCVCMEVSYLVSCFSSLPVQRERIKPRASHETAPTTPVLDPMTSYCTHAGPYKYTKT